MAKIKFRIEEWEEWLIPYLEKKEFIWKNTKGKITTVKPYYCVKSVPISEMILHDMNVYLKYPVHGVCTKCGKKFSTLWSNYNQRVLTKRKIICGNCAIKQVTSSDEWRNANSKAQLKVQTSPEARLNMSKILKRKHKDDPSLKKKISKGLLKTYKDNPELRKKISDASKRHWKNEEYRNKCSGRNYHHGYYVCRFGKLYFASSWELMFICWCEDNKDIIKLEQCKDRIKYIKPSGGTAYYYPDFVVEFDGGVKWVNEIKGNLSEIDVVVRKKEAANKFYGGNVIYSIFFKNDMKRLVGYYRENKKISVWINELVKVGKIEEHWFGRKDGNC